MKSYIGINFIPSCLYIIHKYESTIILRTVSERVDILKW